MAAQAIRFKERDGTGHATVEDLMDTRYSGGTYFGVKLVSSPIKCRDIDGTRTLMATGASRPTTVLKKLKEKEAAGYRAVVTLDGDGGYLRLQAGVDFHNHQEETGACIEQTSRFAYALGNA